MEDTAKPGLDVNLRVIVSSDREDRAKTLIILLMLLVNILISVWKYFQRVKS